MRRLWIFALSLFLFVSLTPAALAHGVIGISLPTTQLDRWPRDGEALVDALTALGHEARLHFAKDDVAVQNGQIMELIENGVSALIVCPVDGEALNESMEAAKAAGIPVLSYDRLIQNTDALACYVTFDNTAVGALQGRAIAEMLDLDTATEPFTLEIFSGPADDSNAIQYYQGAWAELEAYYAQNLLTVKSGQIAFEDTLTAGWSHEAAKARMLTLLADYYPEGNYPNAILAANDAVARGIIEALMESGAPPEHFPVITGQDCDAANLGYIMDGRQAMSVFKDTRALAAEAAMTIDSLLAGEFAASETLGNGVADVPVKWLDPISVNANTAREVLVESGYYAEEKLN